MYNKLAEIYDELMQDVDYDQWVEYLEEIFNSHSNKISRILEVGCGTGNITIPLSKKEYEITGLDISDEMLSIADNKAFQENLNILWLSQDIIDIKVNNKYDCVISCCDSLNYITDIKELEIAFINIYKLLEEGGLFTFDIHSYHKLKDIYGNNTFTYTSDDFNYIWENSYDTNDNIIEYYLTFFIKNENGYYEKFNEKHYQKAYKYNEIVTILAKIGFKNIKSYKFNSFNPINSNNERFQILASK